MPVVEKHIALNQLINRLLALLGTISYVHITVEETNIYANLHLAALAQGSRPLGHLS